VSIHRTHPSALVAAALAAAALAASACSSSAGGAPAGATPGPGQRPGQRVVVPPPPSFDTRNVAPARAELRDLEGRVIGAATFTQAAHGVIVVAELSGLPAGTHAMHVHDVGRCEPPFTTAGAHFNPGGRQHGFKNRNGYHAGDLPNFTAPATGSVRVDAVTQDFVLGPGTTTLFDIDGSSIMVHSGADDYEGDPGGNAGTRIACGVIARATPAGQ
jgi:Cu-Zn family superoxide dismutase